MKQIKKEEISTYNKKINDGIKYIKSGNFDNAEATFLKLISENKKIPASYINLANLYLLQKKEDESIKLLFQYLIKVSLNLEIGNQLAKICIKNNDSIVLKKLLDLFDLRNKNINNYHYLFYAEGHLYKLLQQPEKAILSFKKSISNNHNNIDSYINLLNLLEEKNNLEDFEYYINLGLKNCNLETQIDILNYYRALLHNRKKDYKKTFEIIEKYKLHQKFHNNKIFYIRLIDLESKNFEKLKLYKNAFERVYERNKLLKELHKNKNFDRYKIIDTIQKYKIFYNNKNVNKINKHLRYNDDPDLVFLVGFPRSGTTLLDTILRTHSKIDVLEEKPYLLESRHSFFKNKNNQLDALINITQNEKDLIKSNYLDKIKYKSKNKNNVFVDKLPLSIIEIGFIKCIFPNSKFILALRHPSDVAISCFFSSFKMNDAMINFLDWDNTIDFYNEVFNLYEFYEKELKLNCYKIKYENIVNNFENEIMSLLKFLKLNFEKNMHSFYNTAKNRTKISTPSYTQVINPLYKTSIGRSYNYSEFVDTNKKLNKWIDRFNY